MSVGRGAFAATVGSDGRIYAFGSPGLVSAEAYGKTAASVVVSTTAPTALSVIGGQYSPNPFDVTATVTNGGRTTATDVQATLSLPPGLSLATGTLQQVVGDLAPEQRRQLTWSIRAVGQSQQMNLSYFVTVASSNAAAAYAGKQITVPGGIVTLTSVTPAVGGDTGNVTVTLHGGGFLPGATVKLVKSGQPDIVGSNVSVASDGASLTATFSLISKVRGTWDLSVNNISGTAQVLSNSFTVIEGSDMQATVSVVGPTAFRAGRLASRFYIVIANDSPVDISDAPITISVNGGSQSSNSSFISKMIPGVANENLYGMSSGYVANLPAHGTVLIPFSPANIPSACISLSAQWGSWCFLEAYNVSVKATRYSVHLIDSAIYYTKYKINGCDSNSSLETCQGIITNIQKNQKDMFSDVKSLIDSIKKLSDCLLKHPSSSLNLELKSDLVPEPIPFVGGAARPEIPALPSTLKEDFDYLVSKPATSQEFADYINAKLPPPGPVLDEILSCPVSSLDPNDKIGPKGIGNSRYINVQSVVPFEVMFENKATATAAAQEVIITDQLDPAKVDLGTFTLGPIAFGSRTVTPPSGLSQWSTDVDLRPSQNLILRINAGVDMTTGLATWRFTSLDPATMLLTEDALAGFLPPNVTPPEGDGSVLFTISPKSGLATGTEIRNKARIYFDTNAPIDTPEWLNTIDASKPSSQVQALGATQASTTFTVNWSGSDQGAGIGDYAIYLSENGGPYTVWLANATATSADFAGQSGSTYAFYSVARDLTGNTEDAPSGADATTQVLAPTPTFTPTATITETPTVTVTPTSTETPTPTATSTPTPATAITFTPTATPVVTGTPTWTPTVTATPTNTPIPVYTLIVNKVGSGKGTVTGPGVLCGGDCQEHFLSGSQVTLTAVPATGNDISDFVGWGGACAFAGTNPTCTVTLTKNETVPVIFVRRLVGVGVGPPPGVSQKGDTLIATLTARTGCGSIVSIQFGTPGVVFNNARVTVISPADGPDDQLTGFTYVPPAGTTSVMLLLQRNTPSGGATVSPIRFTDSCGEWITLVGGGPNAFNPVGP